MQPRNRKSSSKKKRIPDSYLSGEARAEQLNRDLAAGALDDAQLHTKYGSAPWFLRNPELPPPANRMTTVIKDTEGREYNFPVDRPDEVHVKLKRAPPRWDGSREVLLPNLGDVITLSDERQFTVDNVLLGEYRTNTATLLVTWLSQ